MVRTITILSLSSFASCINLKTTKRSNLSEVKSKSVFFYTMTLFIFILIYNDKSCSSECKVVLWVWLFHRFITCNFKVICNRLNSFSNGIETLTLRGVYFRKCVSQFPASLKSCASLKL